MSRSRVLRSSSSASVVGRWQRFAGPVGVISVIVQRNVRLLVHVRLRAARRRNIVRPRLEPRPIGWLSNGIGFIKDSEIGQSTKVQIVEAEKHEVAGDHCLVCQLPVLVIFTLRGAGNFYSFRRGIYGSDSRESGRGFDSLLYRKKEYPIDSS